MADRFSFVVVSGSARFFKRGHCSYRTLRVLFGALILTALILSLGLADYIRLLRKDLSKKRIEAELVLQNQELILHRQQIQKFARQINQLKDRLVAINQIDRQIRRVAQMDENEDLFGIGGSTPDDLNTELALDRQHTHLMREMHRQVRELESAAIYQHNSLHNLWNEVEKRGNFMAYTPTIQPAEGWISSRFGYRESPFTGEREFHHGLDIANSWNSPICATAQGRISFAGATEGFGRLVVIDHGHGLTTLYGHLEKILKNRDDRVKRGETIALMGSTGRSTGIHLHYEVRLNGMPVNPQKYFLN